MIDCAFPYKTVSITHRGGYQICPFANPISNTLEQTPKEFFRSDIVSKIRDDMAKGNLTDDIKYTCKACFDLEEKNLPSHRITPTNKRIELQTIAVANFGNKCNLKCVGCGPERSSNFGPEFDTWKEHNFDVKNLRDAKLITLCGGEALYTKYPKLVLKETDCEVHITTNGTILPKWIFDYKDRIKFQISLDGIGKLDEYIRVGTDWDVKLRTMEKLVEFDHEFIVTMQLANHKYIQSIVDFLKSQYSYELNYVNQLTEPKYLSPKPDQYNLMQGLGFFKNKDKKEGTNFLDFYPEYEELYHKAEFNSSFNMVDHTDNIPPIVTYDIRNSRIF